MSEERDDVYLEPTIELSSDSETSLDSNGQEIKVVICESGC
jgi:hypothetical protein